MANKMLIDALHPEETRVVTVRGSKIEEFDFESASRRQLRGNIYLAKVTRVEPSLQAAFIEYGGNRHGFLAFNEIHPDYYQIPVADRQALIEAEAKAEAEEEVRQESRQESRGESREERRPRRTQRSRRVRASMSRRGRDAVVAGPGEAATEEAAAPEMETPEGEPFAPQAATEGDAPALASQGHVPAEDHAPTEDHVAADIPAHAEAAPDFAPQDPAAQDSEAQDSEAQDSAPESQAHEDAPPQDLLAPLASEADEPAAQDIPLPAEALPVGAPAPAEGSTEDEDAEVHDAPEPAMTAEDEEEGDEEDEGDEEEDAEGADEEDDEEPEEHHVVEQVGGHGDALAEIPERPRTHRRQYKIQEVIKRRQILLVQVVKEERGTKGAALTTYLSLAGRYSVLMPNTGKGGGISRKITSAADRKRLKEIATDLEVPDGMGVILRTAGASRTKPEIRRDFEYLMRVWESVRETTMSSSAPSLVYEEGSLIKRAIRDLYGKDIEEILVAGEEAYREAKDFMRMLMPSNAQAVKPYRDTQPLFARHGVEGQLDAMFSNHVSLRSGGYLVINPTEALVSIDVNSGRATREHDIEDTAYKTNLEAAEEVARQLLLRDLAGLIVIDFIDMEEKRNNRAVEKRLNEALKNDRARIQVGRISPFGLLEMSRQRIRTGVLESSSIVCPHCAGSGFVRATASVALHVLRALEEGLIKSATHNLCLRTRTDVALYILNQKRTHLREIETRFGVSIAVMVDERLATTTVFQVERTEPATPAVPRGAVTGISAVAIPSLEEDEAIDAALAREAAEEAAEEPAEVMPETETGAGAEEEDEAGPEGDGRRRRRRRRRRGGRDERGADEDDSEGANLEGTPEEGEAEEGDEEEPPAEAADAKAVEAEAAGPEREEGGGRRRRRGRRGGRSRERGEPREDAPTESTAASEEDEAERAAPMPVPMPLPIDPAPHPNGTADATAGEASETFAPAMPEPVAPATASVEEPVASAPTLPPTPQPEPVAVVLTPADPDRPKRAGWWSRTKAALGGH